MPSTVVLNKIKNALLNNSTVLDLSGYKISELPEPFVQLTQLQVLSLIECMITEFPEPIAQLTRK